LHSKLAGSTARVQQEPEPAEVEGIAPNSLASWREWSTANVLYFAKHNAPNGGLSPADVRRLSDAGISGCWLEDLHAAVLRADGDSGVDFTARLKELNLSVGGSGKLATAVKALPGFGKR
jgi:hypothetical protein